MQRTNELIFLILAAGRGKRMNSSTPKVLLQLGEKSIITHIDDTIESLLPTHKIYVIGPHTTDVKNHVNLTNTTFAIQEDPLGTGHAAQCALPSLEKFSHSTCIILAGDVPLIRPETLQSLFTSHQSQKNALTILTATLPEDAAAYGRIIEKNGRIIKIVEYKDATNDERNVRKINTGIYAIDTSFLLLEINRLSNDNVQGEYYLTDLAHRAYEKNSIGQVEIENFQETLGINTPEDFDEIKQIYLHSCK